MKVQILRLNRSGYHDLDFIKNEKQSLESITGVKYIPHIKDLDPSLPIILISNTQTQVDKLSQVLLENTILMLHPNSGYDNISKEFREKISFPIVKGNEIRAKAVSEYILSALFSHFNSIPNHRVWDETRSWSRSLVSDQKILILGHGQIGQLLYQTLSPLVPNLIVVDPKIDIQQDHVQTTLEDEHFQKLDVLLLACDLNENNINFIDKEKLTNCSENLLIINAARGALINESDLSFFMANNKNAVSYLDVFHEEPFKPSKFSSHTNILKTSHIAGVHNRLNQSTVEFEKRKIEQFLGYFEKDSSLERYKKAYRGDLL